KASSISGSRRTTRRKSTLDHDVPTMSKNPRTTLFSSLLAMGALAAVSSTAVAAPPDLCISSGYGVPSRYGPPRWSTNHGWTAGQTHAIGDEVMDTMTTGPKSTLLYRATTAGTSGASAPASAADPFNASIDDGGVKWQFVTTIDDTINDPRW